MAHPTSINWRDYDVESLDSGVQEIAEAFAWKYLASLLGRGFMATPFTTPASGDSLLDFTAGVLAIEFAQALQEKDCRLPSSVVTIARQGITAQLSVDGTTTGIPEVDTVVRVYNPYRLVAPATVRSPDTQVTA